MDFSSVSDVLKVMGVVWIVLTGYRAWRYWRYGLVCGLGFADVEPCAVTHLADSMA
jgi:hypothetical protein